MSRNRTETEDCTAIAALHMLSVNEVHRAVQSFFDAILSDARQLPFNDERRIYYQELFDDYVKVWNIPHIGRIGPVYSRYLKWRENESKNLGQMSREEIQRLRRQKEIQSVAESLLSGEQVPELKKTKRSEMYNRIWMVSRNGKRSAHQAIPKEK